MPIFSGKHFANPAIGRGYEKNAASEKKPTPLVAEESAGGGETHGHPPAHTVSVHKAGEKFHSLGHHDAGVHVTEHDSQQEAMDHAAGCMGSEEGGMQDGESDPSSGGGFMGGLK